jgi:hypothetical protein
VLYDALAPHVALVMVVDPNRKDPRKPNFIGEVFPFFPLCIDEGSFSSMPNRERGAVAVNRQASRTANGRVVPEQFEHLYRRWEAVCVKGGTHVSQTRSNDCGFAVYFAVQVLRQVAAANDESAEKA